MNDRTFDILRAAVKEFIDTGEPISSGWLFDRYEFGIKPAMIRLELRGLEDEGYLEQPNHSAGRVPTDKGFRVFAEKALEAEPSAPQDALAGFLEKGMLPDLLDGLSAALGLLGVAAEMPHGAVYKEGLDALVDRLEWDTPAEIRSVVKDFEAIDERVGAMPDIANADGFLKVFIGSQSPVTKSNCLAVFAADYDVGGERIVLLGIGPKRMNYEKAAKIFKGLKHGQRHGRTKSK